MPASGRPVLLLGAEALDGQELLVEQVLAVDLVRAGLEVPRLLGVGEGSILVARVAVGLVLRVRAMGVLVGVGVEGLFGLALLAVLVLLDRDGPELVDGARDVHPRPVAHDVVVRPLAHLRAAHGDAALGELEAAIAHELGSVPLLARPSRLCVFERNGVLGGLSGQLGDLSAVDEIPALSVLLARRPTPAAFAASLRIRR